ESVAAMLGGRRSPSRFFPAGKGIFRIRMRARASAGLAAGSAGGNLAHSLALARGCAMISLTPEAYAVIEGRHSDPFHYLGPHVENDSSVVRVFLPDAEEVAVIYEEGH